MSAKSIDIGLGPMPAGCKREGRKIVCEELVEPKDFEEWSKTDVFLGHLYLVVIAAILSFALTQMIKPFISKKWKEHEDVLIRGFAIVVGGLIAYTLSDPFQIIDVYLGASAGVLNAFVIKMFKLKVKKSLGVEDSEI